MAITTVAHCSTPSQSGHRQLIAPGYLRYRVTPQRGQSQMLMRIRPASPQILGSHQAAANVGSARDATRKAASARGQAARPVRSVTVPPCSSCQSSSADASEYRADQPVSCRDYSGPIFCLPAYFSRMSWIRTFPFIPVHSAIRGVALTTSPMPIGWTCATPLRSFQSTELLAPHL